MTHAAATVAPASAVEASRIAREARAAAARRNSAAATIASFLRGRRSSSRTLGAVARALEKRNGELLKLGILFQVKQPTLLFVPPLPVLRAMIRDAVLLCQPARRAGPALTNAVRSHARLVLPVLESAAASLLAAGTAPSLRTCLTDYRGRLRLLARIAGAALPFARAPLLPRVWSVLGAAPGAEAEKPTFVSAGAELLAAVAAAAACRDGRTGAPLPGAHDLWRDVVYECLPLFAVRAAMDQEPDGSTDIDLARAAAAREGALRAALCLVDSAPDGGDASVAEAQFMLGPMAAPGLVEPGGLAACSETMAGRARHAAHRREAALPGPPIVPFAGLQSAGDAALLFARCVAAWAEGGLPVDNTSSAAAASAWPREVFVLGNLANALLTSDAAVEASSGVAIAPSASSPRPRAAGAAASAATPAPPTPGQAAGAVACLGRTAGLAPVVGSPALTALASGPRQRTCMLGSRGMKRLTLLDVGCVLAGDLLVGGALPAALWRDADPMVWTRDPVTLTHVPRHLPYAVKRQLAALASAQTMRLVGRRALAMEAGLLRDERLRAGREDNFGVDDDGGEDGAAGAGRGRAGGGAGSGSAAEARGESGIRGFLRSLWQGSGWAASVMGRKRGAGGGGADAAGGYGSGPDGSAAGPPSGKDATEAAAAATSAAAAAAASQGKAVGDGASVKAAVAWGGDAAFSATSVLALCQLVACIASGEAYASAASSAFEPAADAATRRARRELDARRSPLDRRPALTALAFDPALRAGRLLAYFFLDSVDTRDLVQNHAFRGKARPHGAFAVLYAACAALSRQALVLDDLELHDATAPQPLPKPQLRAMVRVATDTLAHAFAAPRGWWPGSGAAADEDPTPFWPELRGEMAALLEELHSRHSRRPIGPESVWAVAANVRGPEMLQGLLQVAPFSVPFRDRVAMFRRQCDAARAEWLEAPGVRIQVARPNLFGSAMAAVSSVPAGHMHRRLAVEFTDAAGLPEAGIDAGGLFKDLWTGVAGVGFDPSYGLFRATDQSELFPNPSSALAVGDDDAIFQFLGRVLGKALLEGVTVSPRFAPFFLTKLLGKPAHLHFLSTLDKGLYANLMFVRTYAGDVENDLCLTMVLPTDDELAVGAAAAAAASGRAAAGLEPTAAGEIPLVPGGQDVPVTNQNRLQYVHLVADARLNKSIARQTAAFRRGLDEVIPPAWLRVFSEPELQTLISGTEAGIDVEDLKAHARYSGWGGGDPTVVAFWEVVADMSARERAALLRFVTACERPPPLGFRDLNPPFTLQRVPDVSRLPTASTCFNVLKLPAIRSKDRLRERLLASIFSGAGFDLS